MNGLSVFARDRLVKNLYQITQSPFIGTLMIVEKCTELDPVQTSLYESFNSL